LEEKFYTVEAEEDKVDDGRRRKISSIIVKAVKD
jgi:hypothetical protein